MPYAAIPTRPWPADSSRETDGKPGFAEEALPHLHAVYRFALRLARGDEAEAQDLVQDTYLRAYKSWEGYSRGTRCCSWLFTICRNVAVRRNEKKSRQIVHVASSLGFSDLDDIEPWDDRGGGFRNPEDEFFEGTLDDDVVRAIDSLPIEYRDAVVLCDLEGYGYSDIADRLGVAGGTIKSRIHRGRRLLHGLLRSYAVEVGHIEQ